MNLKCQYERVSSASGTKYFCQISNIRITKPETEIESLKGNHQAGKTDENVEGLRIDNAVVEHFPQGFHKFFPRLTHLEIFECGLKEISSSDLDVFGNLESLTLCCNNLKSLPENLFTHMQKLKRIDLSNNKIGNVSAKLLDPLDRDILYFVNFLDNPSINDFYERGNSGKSLERLIKSIKKSRKIKLEGSDEETAEDDAYMSSFTDDQIKIRNESSRKEKIEKMLISGEMFDYTIKVHNKEFKVHKNILAAQSSVFYEMFTNNSETGVRIMKNATNWTQKGFEEFMRYFNTGKVFSEDHALELFKLASEFDVPELKNISENILLKNLNTTSALKVFRIGQAHGSEIIKQAAFEVLKTMCLEVADYMYSNPELVTYIITAKASFESCKHGKFESEDE